MGPACLSSHRHDGQAVPSQPANDEPDPSHVSVLFRKVNAVSTSRFPSLPFDDICSAAEQSTHCMKNTTILMLNQDLDLHQLSRTGSGVDS